MAHEKAELLGFTVDLVDMREALAIAEGFLASKKTNRIVTLNPEMIIQSRRRPGLRAALDGADLYLPETSGMAWALRVAKIPGIEFMEELLGSAADCGASVYLLGSESRVVEEAAAAMTERHPGLRIVGFRDGYFSHDEEEAIIEEIASLKPDILLVGMGAERQETFISRHRDEFGAKIVIGLGGSFDVVSGRIARAPEAFRKRGLEWVYRLVTQPKRLWRMASRLPLFAVLVLRERISTR